MKTLMKLMSWGPLIGALITGRIGYDWKLYGSFWWFDLLQHAVFFFALGLLMLQYSSNVPFVVSLGLSLGVLWEVLEWVYYTGWFHNRWEAGDTYLDLCIDLLGVGLAIAVVNTLHYYRKYEPQWGGGQRGS